MKAQIAAFALVSLLAVAYSAEVKCHMCGGIETVCGPDALNGTDPMKICMVDPASTTANDICLYNRDVDAAGVVTYTRSCAQSSVSTNGKKSNCDSYNLFGLQKNICSCQTELCNGAVAGSASLGLALCLAALVAKLSM